MQQASFDSYAESYDHHFTFSPIGVIQREAVYRNLLPLLNQNKSVLELNCGTGHDAFTMIDEVSSILATDVSEEMIRVCEEKQGINSKRPTFRAISIQNLNEELKTNNFIFSNFAGLNCLAPVEFTAFANKCRELAKAETDLFLVFFGRKCIWERFYYLAKFDIRAAKRRSTAEAITMTIGSAQLDFWYYSPSEIRAMFSSNFKVQSYGPIGLFVPPSYLDNFFKNKRILLKLLGSLDKYFCKFKMLAN